MIQEFEMPRCGPNCLLNDNELVATIPRHRVRGGVLYQTSNNTLVKKNTLRTGEPRTGTSRCLFHTAATGSPSNCSETQVWKEWLAHFGSATAAMKCRWSMGGQQHG